MSTGEVVRNVRNAILLFVTITVLHCHPASAGKQCEVPTLHDCDITAWVWVGVGGRGGGVRRGCILGCDKGKHRRCHWKVVTPSFNHTLLRVQYHVYHVLLLGPKLPPPFPLAPLSTIYCTRVQCHAYRVCQLGPKLPLPRKPGTPRQPLQGVRVKQSFTICCMTLEHTGRHKASARGQSPLLSFSTASKYLM